MTKNTEFKNLSLLITVCSIVVIVLGTGLLWQDIVSTKVTITDYFPDTFGVTPSTDEFGAYIMSAFTSAVEIVALFVLLNKYFDNKYRVIAGIMYLVAFAFDSWADVSMRSGWYKDDVSVQTAIAVTFAFYTVGSEMATSIAWLVLTVVGRKGWSEFLELATNIFVVAGSTGHEISLLKKKAERENERHISLQTGGNGQTMQNQNNNRQENREQKRPSMPMNFNQRKPEEKKQQPQQNNRPKIINPVHQQREQPSYNSGHAQRMRDIQNSGHNQDMLSEEDFDEIVRKNGYNF